MLAKTRGVAQKWKTLLPLQVLKLSLGGGEFVGLVLTRSMSGIWKTNLLCWFLVNFRNQSKDTRRVHFLRLLLLLLYGSLPLPSGDPTLEGDNSMRQCKPLSCSVGKLAVDNQNSPARAILLCVAQAMCIYLFLAMFNETGIPEDPETLVGFKLLFPFMGYSFSNEVRNWANNFSRT
jgi:hypothetical protein